MIFYFQAIISQLCISFLVLFGLKISKYTFCREAGTQPKNQTMILYAKHNNHKDIFTSFCRFRISPELMEL